MDAPLGHQHEVLEVFAAEASVKNCRCEANDGHNQSIFKPKACSVTRQHSDRVSFGQRGMVGAVPNERLRKSKEEELPSSENFQGNLSKGRKHSILTRQEICHSRFA